MYTTSLILSRFLPLFHNPISNWKKKERKKKESNNSTRLSKCEEPQFSLFIPSSKGKKRKVRCSKNCRWKGARSKANANNCPFFTYVIQILLQQAASLTVFFQGEFSSNKGGKKATRRKYFSVSK